jgi:hypothetical protein
MAVLTTKRVFDEPDVLNVAQFWWGCNIVRIQPAEANAAGMARDEANGRSLPVDRDITALPDSGE